MPNTGHVSCGSGPVGLLSAVLEGSFRGAHGRGPHDRFRPHDFLLIHPKSIKNRAQKPPKQSFKKTTQNKHKKKQHMSNTWSPKGDPWGPQGGPTNHQPRTGTPKFLKTVFSLESHACRFLFFSNKNAKIARSAPVRTGAPFWDVGAMPVQKKWGPLPRHMPPRPLPRASQATPRPHF